MADNKNPRRPVAGSRIPSRSPRRLAGQSARPEPPSTNPESEAPRSTARPLAGTAKADRLRVAPDTAADDTRAAAEAEARAGVLQRARTTKVLAVLVGVAAVLLVLLAVLQTQEPDAEGAVVWSPVSRADEFRLPDADEVPVTVDALDWSAAVDELAHSVTKVLSFNHETIDQQQELAAELVTPEFLEEDLSKTIEETAPKLKQNKAEYTVTVAGQSVISATPDRVRALLFVNQLVTKGTGKDAVSDNYPLRLDVEGVREGDTWLISSLNAG